MSRIMMDCPHRGAVAQLVERLVRNEEVRGSIPLSSTTIFPNIMVMSSQLLNCWAAVRAVVPRQARAVTCDQSNN